MFPAGSVALAVIAWVPAAKVAAVIVQFPPVATPVPITVVPSNTVTMLPASAVPVKVGLATSVMLSVLDTPVSDAAIRSGADGIAGAIVSMVIDKAPDAALTLPVTSAILVVMAWVPAARVAAVMVHVPAVATPVPISLAPSYSVTVSPISAMPVKVGFVTFVILSVLEIPLSVEPTR